MHTLNRDRQKAGLSALRFVSILLMLLFANAGVGFAQQANWNGTWVGNWQTGHGIQVIFAGNDLIGVYWHEDYIEETAASASADGVTMTISWPGVRAVLTRDGPEAAHIVIRETGRPDTAFALTRDHS